MTRARTEIIAEIGVNHNGDPALARAMVEAAAVAGADVVKLQTYRAEEVMTADTPLADYMLTGNDREGFLDLARRLELADAHLGGLQELARERGVELLSSPFDVPSVYVLANLGFGRLKLPSGELVNPLMLAAAAATGLPLVVSTGMADLEEVIWAVDYLRARQAGPIALLHCLTQYPAEYRHVNLLAMLTLRERLGLPVGFSDHTPGWEIAVAAVALGATIVEKHFTLDRHLPGPDQHASLTPDEFRDMVDAIRHVEEALGDGVKRPAEPELVLRPIVRKSLMLRQPAPAGCTLQPHMLTAKRPGTGIPARRYDGVVGARLLNAMGPDQPLQESDLVRD